MTGKLLIGWASADITPDRPVQLQGQFHQRISERVRDPITATALALETKGEDGDQAVIVSCDLVGVSKDLQETVREKVAARVGDLDVKKVFMAATHTHTGPVLHESLRYPDLPDGVMSPAESRGLVVDGVSEAVITAWNGRKEGSAGWALGHAAVGFNRRLSYADGNSQMYGKSDRPDFMQVEGCQDPGIEILFTWNAAGAPTGVVVNPACPSQVVEGKLFLSADFWDEARLRLKRRFGSDFSVLPLCSAAGDQSPRDLVRRGRGEADMQALRSSLALLKRGYIFALSPEGTRNHTGILIRARPGVVTLALHSGAALMPIAHWGGECFGYNLTHLKRTDFHVRVGEAFTLKVKVGRVTRQARQQMVDEMMYRLAALLPEAFRGVYADLESATEKYINPVKGL